MVLETPVLEDFGGVTNLEFPRFERWRSIEKSCWINRCYFLAPMARMAWLKDDADLAHIVMQVMLHFHRTCPAPADLEAHWQRVTSRMQEDYNSKSPEEIAKDETDVEYIWYDMQPGQRLLIFLYAGYFLWNNPGVTEAERIELLACLKRHTRVLADQELFQQSYCDNHQSLRSMVLYYALPLLADEPDFAQVEAMTFHLSSWHVLNEFLTSGMLFEYSPSYQAFALWHARDFQSLARQRGARLDAKVERRIAAAAAAQACFRRPDNLTLTINDAYQFDATALLASLGSGIKVPDVAVLNPGGLAVAHVGDCYAAIDASGFIGKFSHYHGGKNSPVVLYKGVPFLEEAGCPSYDTPEFADCKKALWHSSMLVDGEGDTHQFGLYGFDGWAELEYAQEWTQGADGAMRFAAKETSNVPAWAGVTWKRTVAATGSSVEFTDVVQANKLHTYTLMFNFAPGASVMPGKDASEWVIENGGVTARFLIASETRFAAQLVTIGNCQQKACRKALQLNITFEPAATLNAVSRINF